MLAQQDTDGLSSRGDLTSSTISGVIMAWDHLLKSIPLNRTALEGKSSLEKTLLSWLPGLAWKVAKPKDCTGFRQKTTRKDPEQGSWIWARPPPVLQGSR